MLGEEYSETYTRDSIRALLLRLAALGAKKVVLTGISFDDDKLGCVTYDSATGEYGEYFTEKLPVAMHGTGDVYASAFVGALRRGKTNFESAKIAADYTVKCIENTQGDADHWYGVKFEPVLSKLIDALK